MTDHEKLEAIHSLLLNYLDNEEASMDDIKDYLVIYHYDGADVDTIKVSAESAEHAVDLAHEQLALRAEREGAAHFYYLDLLIDPYGGEVLERL